MNNYAILLNGIVINVIVWDGVAPYDLPAPQTMQLIPPDTMVDIGYKYDGTTFSA